MTGRIEGVLDLTCLIEHSTPMLHSIVRSAATDVEQSLLHDRNLRQQALFEAFLSVDSHSKSAVFAIGGRVMMANALAQTTFDPVEQRMIVHHARYLMECRSPAGGEIELPGDRLAHLRGTRVSAGSEIAGIVVEVLDAQERSARAFSWYSRHRTAYPPSSRLFPRKQPHRGLKPGQSLTAVAAGIQ